MNDFVAISTGFRVTSAVRDKCIASVKAQTIPVRHIYHDADQLGGACLENVYHYVHDLSPSTIVLWIDGDDYLAHSHVVDVVDQYYRRGAWMTWGQFITYNGAKRWIGHCRDAKNRRMCRKDAWYASHLKTFRAGLFQKIKRQDLFFEGAWNPECCDCVVMWPLLELSDDRGRFIKDVLYVYNYADRQKRQHDNPHTFLGQRQIRAHAYLKKLPVYPRLETLPT